MTKQEYYDLLVKSAQDGTFPSAVIHDNMAMQCLYRADQTPHSLKRCAGGLLIDDEKYSPDLETVRVTMLALSHPGIFNLPEGLSVSDINAIQREHDEACDWKNKSIVWYKEQFIDCINALSCFADVVKVSPDAA